VRARACDLKPKQQLRDLTEPVGCVRASAERMRVRACVGGGSTESAAAVELGLWVTTIGRQVGGGWTRGGFSRGGGGGLRATGRVELPACVQCVIYGLAGRQPATVVVVVVVVVRVRVVRVCARALCVQNFARNFFLFLFFVCY